MEQNFEKKERYLLMAGTFLIVANCFAGALGGYGNRTSPPMFVAALILTVITFRFYLKDKIVGRLPLYVSIPLIIMGLSFCLWGVVYFVPTYILFGYTFLILLPLFYVCVKKESMKLITLYFSRSYVIVSAAVIAVCLLAAPLTGGQYYGVFNNPNLLGQFLSSAAVFTIYLYEVEDSRKARIFMLALFGMLVAFTLFSRSRTTLLAFACIAVAYALYCLITRTELLKRVLAFVLAMVIMVPLAFGCFNIVTPKVCDITGIDIDMYSNGLEEELTDAYNRYLKGIADEGSFFSGRTNIWADFMADMGFKGHKEDALTVKYSGGEFSVNAHNTVLQVGYQSGFLSGIAFLILYIVIGISALRRILNKKATKEDLFAAACAANTLPYVVLASVVGPLTTFMMLPLWLIAVPDFFVTYKKGEE